MAMRLVDAGYRLRVFDPDAAAAAPFVARGAVLAHSPADVAAHAGLVLMCLPTPAVVRAVVLGDDGLVRGAAVRVIVDLGTTGPGMEKAIAAGAAAQGVTVVDSPVTGGIAGATAGTLAVIVACPDEAFGLAEPVLRHLGRIFRAGTETGLAQIAKLANNMLSASALAVSAEAMAMGVKAGIAPEVLLDIINAGSGRNSATEDKFPRAILPGTFAFGMKAGLFLKDVRLCVEEAESLGVPMVAGAAVRAMFAATRARFGDDADFTRIAQLVEEWAHVEVRSTRAPADR